MLVKGGVWSAKRKTDDHRPGEDLRITEIQRGGGGEIGEKTWFRVQRNCGKTEIRRHWIKSGKLAEERNAQKREACVTGRSTCQNERPEPHRKDGRTQAQKAKRSGGFKKVRGKKSGDTRQGSCVSLMREQNGEMKSNLRAK